jgi:hypothetical protein
MKLSILVRSVKVVKYVNTVEKEQFVNFVEVVKYVFMVVGEIIAKNAEALKFVFTVVISVIASTVEVRISANINSLNKTVNIAIRIFIV